ncbi:uncharacterized protein LOC142563166 isoform X2 [Dermacentor variabilis]|uniref:uncharacterized protein LOC142563166 isoform X2 n=1 Tax=Dermacentor variabilis TaxID=34621 RepID=UPI003F5B4468
MTEISGLQRMFIKLHAGFRVILTSTEIPQGVHDGGGLSSFLRLVQFYCEHSLQSRRQAEFIKERVKASAKLWQDIEASMKRIRDLGLRAKSGIAYDVARSFEDVKIEHVHQLTRIQDARDQGFRLHWSLRNFFLSSSPPPYWQ